MNLRGKTEFNTKLNMLKTIYEENRQDGMFTYRTNNKEFFMTKSNAIEILFELSNDNSNISLIKDFIRTLYTTSNTPDESRIFSRLYDMVKEFKIEEIYNSKKYINNGYIKKINERIQKIREQCNYYDGFQMNQNNFDNMISLIKITQRLENEHIYLDSLKSFEFDSEMNREQLNDLKILMKNEGYNQYNNIRFIV